MLMILSYKIFSCIIKDNIIVSKIKIFFLKRSIFKKINKMDSIKDNNIIDICSFEQNVMKFIYESNLISKCNDIGMVDWLFKNTYVIKHTISSSIYAHLKLKCNYTIIKLKVNKSPSYKGCITIVMYTKTMHGTNTFNTEIYNDGIKFKDSYKLFKMNNFEKYFKKDLKKLINNAISLLYFINKL